MIGAVLAMVPAMVLAVGVFPLLLASVLGAALAWSAYFYLKDRYQPEPRSLLFFVFLAGAASTGPAWFLYRSGEWIGLDLESIAIDPSRHIERLLLCVLVIGTIEELCKFLSVQVLIGKAKAFDEPIDGLIYAAFGGLGFASIESLVLCQWLDGPERWGRILAAPLTHALFAAAWGYALSLDRLARPRRPFRVALGLLNAIVCHGIYDFLVLGPNWMRPFGALLILGLWIWFFRSLAHEYRKSERAREPEETAEAASSVP